MRDREIDELKSRIVEANDYILTQNVKIYSLQEDLNSNSRNNHLSYFDQFFLDRLKNNSFLPSFCINNREDELESKKQRED